MGLVSKDDGWRVPDRTWERMVGCFRLVRRIRSAVTTRGCRTAVRWTRSCWCCAQGCSGTRSTGPGSARRARRTVASRSGSRRACSPSSGGRDCSPTTSCKGSTGSGSHATARWARRRLAARLLARTRLIERKRGETIRRLRRWWPPDRARDRRREHQRLQAPPRDSRKHPDRAAGRRRPALVGPLPGQRLRLPGGVRARRRARLHPAHPRPWRGKESTRTRPRLPRTPLGDRAYPLLAEPIPRAARALVEEARKPPRPSPTRLRNHRLANGDRRDPSGIGSKCRASCALGVRSAVSGFGQSYGHRARLQHPTPPDAQRRSTLLPELQPLADHCYQVAHEATLRPFATRSSIRVPVCASARMSLEAGTPVPSYTPLSSRSFSRC